MRNEDVLTVQKAFERKMRRELREKSKNMAFFYRATKKRRVEIGLKTRAIPHYFNGGFLFSLTVFGFLQGAAIFGATSNHYVPPPVRSRGRIPLICFRQQCIAVFAICCCLIPFAAAIISAAAEAARERPPAAAAFRRRGGTVPAPAILRRHTEVH